MTDEDKKKVEAVEAFLKRFTVVIDEADEKRENEAWTYDVGVHFDGEKLFDTKWGGGSYWDPAHVNEAGGNQIVESLFGDAEAYASCVEHGVDDELDALDNFMSEFGYDKVKPAMKAFKGCKAIYGKLCDTVFYEFGNGGTPGADRDAVVMGRLCDVVNYFNQQFENEVDDGLVKLEWEGDE